ncbi:hypothetical protein [Bacillus altitudinis]|uniref:hypothetical protein n=1 Tax=Bacillus altitudinis TaxID=293387 RepID=UPI001F6173C5|nr:hypothetical protein [Bacillus altitudinis]
MKITNSEIGNSPLRSRYPTAVFIQCNYDKSKILKVMKPKIRHRFGLKRKLLANEYSAEMEMVLHFSKTTVSTVYYKYLPEIDTVLWSVDK